MKLINGRRSAVNVGGLTVLRCLGNKGIPLVLATSEANKPAFYSRYCNHSHLIPGPTSYPEKFVGALMALGRSLQVGSGKPVLFYDGDADLRCISRNRERLSTFFDFSMPEPEVIENLLDKARFRKYAVEKALPVPPSCVLQADQDIQRVTADIGFPLIIKPITRVGWFLKDAFKWSGGGKAIQVDNEAQLKKLLERLEGTDTQVLVQKLVSGGEENIVSYHSVVSAKGELMGEFCGKKHRTYPVAYGLSSCIEVVKNIPDLIEIGRQVLANTGLTGVSKMDFKRDVKTGELYLLEINPRYSIWNHPGAVAGVNLPLISYEEISGCDDYTRGPVKAVKPVKWIDGNLDFKSLHQITGSYLVAAVRSIANLVGRNVYHIWSWKDPLPLVSSLMHKLTTLIFKVPRKLVRMVRQ